jgi:peptidoglycan/LPS O-acetylase OafA/YrhL
MEPLLAVSAALPVTAALASLAVVGAVLLASSRAARSWLDRALALPSPTHGPSLAGVNALRGFAALWVALFHFWQWPGATSEVPMSTFSIITYGGRAVPLFVVISGFVIWGTASHIATILDLRRYAINRILRLFPLFAVVVLATMVLGYFNSRGILPGQSMWKAALHELVMARSFNSSFFLLPPSWSLFIEVNFYVLAPIAAALITRRKLLVLSVLALAFYLAEFAGDAREFGLWKYFFIGMLARELGDAQPASLPEAVPVASFAAGAGLLLLDLRYDWVASGLNALGIPGWPVYGDLTFGLGLASAALIFGAVKSRSIGRVLGIMPFRMLGGVSYSIFLWHGVLVTLDTPIYFTVDGKVVRTAVKSFPPDFGWPMLVIVVPALLIVGVASFLLIERPFLRLRPRRSATEGPAPVSTA